MMALIDNSMIALVDNVSIALVDNVMMALLITLYCDIPSDVYKYQ